jgi:hypothetical protein
LLKVLSLSFIFGLRRIFMKKIFFLILTLAAGYTYSDMNIISYSSAELDGSNSNLTLEQDYFDYKSYNSSTNQEWMIVASSGEIADAGTVTADFDSFQIGYRYYFEDRSSAMSPYAETVVDFLSLETNANAAVRLLYDASLITIKGGYALVPEQGFGYDVGAGFITTIYDEDPSNATVLNTETDFTFSGSISYALENGLRFTAALMETGDDSSDIKSFVGIGYQF